MLDDGTLMDLLRNSTGKRGFYCREGETFISSVIKRDLSNNNRADVNKYGMDVHDELNMLLGGHYANKEYTNNIDRVTEKQKTTVERIETIKYESGSNNLSCRKKSVVHKTDVYNYVGCCLGSFSNNGNDYDEIHHNTGL
jgi:hypothetical protein